MKIKFQISFMIDFDTMEIKLLDEKGRDILDKPVEELESMAAEIAEELARQEEGERIINEDEHKEL